MSNVDNPAVEETEKEFVARMEMPGFEPENILIEVMGERLHVKAERKYEKEEKGGKEWRTTYQRHVTLPAAVVAEKARPATATACSKCTCPRPRRPRPGGCRSPDRCLSPSRSAPRLPEAERRCLIPAILC